MIHCMRNYVDKAVVKSTNPKEGILDHLLHKLDTFLNMYLFKTTIVQRKSALSLLFSQDVASMYRASDRVRQKMGNSAARKVYYAANYAIFLKLI